MSWAREQAIQRGEPSHPWPDFSFYCQRCYKMIKPHILLCAAPWHMGVVPTLIHLADKMSHGVCDNLTVAKKHLYPLTNTHVSIWPVVFLTGHWPYLIFNVRRVLQLCPHSLPLFNNFVWFSVYRDSVSCHLYPSGLPHLCQYTACGMFTRPSGAHPEWFEWESGGHSWGALKTLRWQSFFLVSELSWKTFKLWLLTCCICFCSWSDFEWFYINIFHFTVCRILALGLFNP